MLVSFHVLVTDNVIWSKPYKESYMNCVLENYDIPKNNKELIELENELKELFISYHKDSQLPHS